MKRFVAVLLLVVLAVALVAPIAAPPSAYAATGDVTMGGLPQIPWAQVWAAIKTWGPMLIYLLDAAITALTGGGTPPPNPPPPPPPPQCDAPADAPSLDGAAGVAWGGALTAAGWA